MPTFIKAGLWVEKQIGYKAELNLDKFVQEHSSGGGGASVTTITKSNLDTLVNNNNLSVGSIYKIIGVDPTLYDDGTTQGTTIYLEALTTNKLSLEGNGLFYVPKYNQAIEEYGIWSNRSTWTATAGTGTFQRNENITADNGATGELFTNLDANLFISTGGDWATATSITGDNSNATATITDVVLKSYTIGDKVIWGGYSWTNLMGFVGNSVNSLVMDFEWSKDIFDLNNYNLVLDIIHYDFDNDAIIYRADKSGNVVDTSKANIDYWSVYYGYDGNPINVFQWGNNAQFDINNYENIGVGNNIIENSYCQNINFSGSYFNSNSLSGYSIFDSNTLSGGSIFDSNSLTSNSRFYSNSLSGNSRFYSNSLSGGSRFNSNSLSSGSSFVFNTLSNSSGFYSNSLSGNSLFYSNSLSGYSRFDYNTLSGNSIFDSNTLSSGSSFYSNSLSGSYINQNSLSGNSSFQSNTLSDNCSFNYNILDSDSYFESNTLSNSSLFDSNTLSNSSGFQSNSLSNSRFYSNSLTSNSNFYSNSLSNSSGFQSNTLSNSSLFDSNTLSGGSYFDFNSLSNSSNFYSNSLTSNSNFYSNSLSNSIFDSNTLSNSSFQSNNLSSGSGFYSNSLSSGSYFNSNNLSNSGFQFNTLSDSSFDYNTLSGGSYFNIGLSYPIISKQIQNLIAEKGTINIDITSATIIYDNYPRTLFSLPNGTNKLRYYDDTSTLIIVDVNE